MDKETRKDLKGFVLIIWIGIFVLMPALIISMGGGITEVFIGVFFASIMILVLLVVVGVVVIFTN